MLGIVGTAVIKSLQNIDHQLDLYAGIRDVVADKNKLDGFTIKFSPFDFSGTIYRSKQVLGWASVKGRHI